jgi:hypothetical protein
LNPEFVEFFPIHHLTTKAFVNRVNNLTGGATGAHGTAPAFSRAWKQKLGTEWKSELIRSPYPAIARKS